VFGLLKPCPHQQQCRSNIVECYKLNDSFDNVECCFDIVAVFGNNVASFGNSVERNFVVSNTNLTCMLSLFRLCKKDKISFDIVAETGNIVDKNGNNVVATFDIVERIVQLVAFDNVASTFDNPPRVDILEGPRHFDDPGSTSSPRRLGSTGVSTV